MAYLIRGSSLDEIKENLEELAVDLGIDLSPEFHITQISKVIKEEIKERKYDEELCREIMNRIANDRKERKQQEKWDRRRSAEMEHELEIARIKAGVGRNVGSDDWKVRTPIGQVSNATEKVNVKKTRDETPLLVETRVAVPVAVADTSINILRTVNVENGRKTERAAINSGKRMQKLGLDMVNINKQENKEKIGIKLSCGESEQVSLKVDEMKISAGMHRDSLIECVASKKLVNKILVRPSVHEGSSNNAEVLGSVLEPTQDYDKVERTDGSMVCFLETKIIAVSNQGLPNIVMENEVREKKVRQSGERLYQCGIESKLGCYLPIPDNTCKGKSKPKVNETASQPIVSTEPVPEVQSTSCDEPLEDTSDHKRESIMHVKCSRRATIIIPVENKCAKSVCCVSEKINRVDFPKITCAKESAGSVTKPFAMLPDVPSVKSCSKETIRFEVMSVANGCTKVSFHTIQLTVKPKKGSKAYMTRFAFLWTVRVSIIITQRVMNELFLDGACKVRIYRTNHFGENGVIKEIKGPPKRQETVKVTKTKREGGMKAVLWTDVFQAILMFLGLFTVLIKGTIDAGGINSVIDRSMDGGRILVPSMNMDLTTRYTVWNIFFAGFVFSTGSFSASQVQVQRMLTVKNVSRSRASLFWSIPMGLSFHLLNCLVGLVLYANFYDCDPIASPMKSIKSTDQMLPYFMMRSLSGYPGLPGLCICGIFSASLSTISSAVNSLSAVTMEDFVRPFLRSRGTSEERAAFFAKAITVFYGTVCIAFTFLVAVFDNLIQASLTVYGMLGGPVLGVFMLGMLTTRAREKGAIIGLMSSILVCTWMSFGGSAWGPAPIPLPISTDGCEAILNINETLVNTTGNEYLEIGNQSLIFSSPLLSNLTFEMDSENNSSYDLITKKNEYIFPLYRISYIWVAPFGFFICFAVGYVSSLVIELVFGGEKQNVSPEFLSPAVRWLVNKKDTDEKDLKMTSLNQIKRSKDGIQLKAVKSNTSK